MRILLLGATTGYQTRMFDEAAARLGHELVMATDRCHVLDDPWGDHAISVRFEKPEWSVAQVANAVHDRPIHGIVALGDRPAYLAAVIAQALGLPYNSPEAAEACSDKFLARRRFAEAGLP